MNSISVSINWLSMLPVYACIFTGSGLALVVLPIQQRIQAASAKSKVFGSRITASRFGSALLILVAAFMLMAGELAILVPLTGGSFA